MILGISFSPSNPPSSLAKWAIVKIKEEDFREVGKIIALRLKNDETDEIKNECLRRVKALTDKVTMYKDLSYED